MARQSMVSIAFAKSGISVDHAQRLIMDHAIQMKLPMRSVLTQLPCESIASSTTTIAL